MPFGKGGRKDKKSPSLTKTYMVDSWRGVPRVRRWPRKRGPAKTPEEKARQQQFADWNEATKYYPAQEQYLAARATHRTNFYPRDLMLMQLSGRLISFRLENGKEYFSMAVRKDVSESLNVLGQTEGDMLWRGPDFWQSFPAGEPGQVLVSNGPSEPPSWITGGGGGGGGVGGAAVRANAVSQFLGGNKDFPWAQPVFDDLGFWDAGVPSRLTIPFGSGIRRVIVSAQIATSASRMLGSIYKNGARITLMDIPGTTGSEFASTTTGVIDCVDGDYFSVRTDDAGTISSFSSISLLAVG